MLEGAMEAAGPGVPEFEISLAAKRKGAYKSQELMAKHYQDNEPFNFPAFSNQQVMTTGHDTTMTHARSGLTELEHGEPLFICHCGTLSFQGFYLGFDRTLFVGEVNSEVSDLLDVAEEAQAASLAKVKPGVTAEEVYEAYAQVIDEAGFDVPFRAGRSVGFSVQESPQLERGNQTKLQEGMIFAMDGGAANENYRTQVGDSILVTADGYEFLTPFTKDHQELVVNN
jgi:Xaa-Pro aminopeptidase